MYQENSIAYLDLDQTKQALYLLNNKDMTDEAVTTAVYQIFRPGNAVDLHMKPYKAMNYSATGTFASRGEYGPENGIIFHVRGIHQNFYFTRRDFKYLLEYHKKFLVLSQLDRGVVLDSPRFESFQYSLF